MVPSLNSGVGHTILRRILGAGELAQPTEVDDGGILRSFREDPEKNALATRSGEIEIFCETIAGFN